MKKKLLKYAGYAVMLAAFVFLVKTIIDMHPDFTKIQNPVASAAIALLSTLIFAVMVYISAFAWKAVLQFIQGGKIRYGLLAPVYVKANIGKYLPGNVMHFAGRNILAGRLGFTQLDIAFCSAVEVLILLLTAGIWSVVLAFRTFTGLLSQGVANLAAHPAVAVAAALLLAGIVTALAMFIVKKQLIAKYRKFFTLSFLRLAVRLFAIYSLTQLLPGIMMLMILAVCFGCQVTPSAVALSIAAYTVSWVAGYIVPGAPGGLGVREAALILILGAAFPRDVVLMTAILHRILSIIGDAVAFACVPLMRKVWPADKTAVTGNAE